MGERWDAVVIGSGPNGLAAAVTLARAGRRVLVREAAPTIGGGCRTAEGPLPGFRYDICAAVHPLGLASPFFQRCPLPEHGLRWIVPPVAVAHPLDNGRVALLTQSLAETGRSLGRDADAYRRLMAPLVADWPRLADSVLAPLRWPRHPLALARFGLLALLPIRWLAERLFRDEPARALLAGIAAHSIVPLTQPATTAAALLLGIQGHRAGWPVAAGGSQRIVDALASYLQQLGGRVETGRPVTDLAELPPARAVLADTTPRQLLRLAGVRLPQPYRWQLGRFRYGPGVFKVDYALDGPIPWRAEDCALAGTVHLGGTLAEIAASEQAVWEGRHPARPFVLLAQPSNFDPTRAPAGRQTVWAYCHVPAGSTVDMSEVIERQIERFAPGFRQRILARRTLGPVALEQYNANYIGGDISAGVVDWRQLLTRPLPSPTPYATPVNGLYLCSASTPPGPGIHGMCGHHAARAALRSVFGHA